MNLVAVYICWCIVMIGAVKLGKRLPSLFLFHLKTRSQRQAEAVTLADQQT